MIYVLGLIVMFVTLKLYNKIFLKIQLHEILKLGIADYIVYENNLIIYRI